MSSYHCKSHTPQQQVEHTLGHMGDTIVSMISAFTAVSAELLRPTWRIVVDVHRFTFWLWMLKVTNGNVCNVPVCVTELQVAKVT